MRIEWWVVLATLAGPVVAIQTQKFIERSTERRRRQQTIFVTLMANRATRLSDDFIRSLNLIDLEFGPRKFGGAGHPKVIAAWRALFGELTQGVGNADDSARISAWNDRVGDRLVDLLQEMSQALGYKFTREELRRGIYYPQGRVELEQLQLAMIRGFGEIAHGRASLPISVVSVPEESGN